MSKLIPDSKESSQQPFLPLAILVSSLYLAQGLPGGFIAHALPAFLRAEGVSLTLIGSLKLLALPWLLKFLWAPLVDGDGSFYRKRKFIFAMQAFAAISLLLLSFVVTGSTGQTVAISLACLLAINLASATQDIATDGITASQTPKSKLGIANSIQVAGYKVGMLIGGSGLLYASSFLSVPDLMRLMSLLLIALLVPLFLFRTNGLDSERSQKVTQVSNQGSIKTVLSSYKGFFRQQGMLPWLLVLLTYKMADSLGSGMLKPMLIDKGFSFESVGEITLYASLVGLLGAAVAGWLYKRVGQYWALVGFGVLQAVSITSFYLIHIDVLSVPTVYALVVFEQFSDGLSTVALFAVMMLHCRKGHEGGDYTIQASLQILLAGVLGVVGGLLADMMGYGAIYILCGLLGVMTLVFVLNYARSTTQVQ